MSTNQRYAVHSSPAENRPKRVAGTGVSADSYELGNTLDAYEVEELDAHGLARFLPEIVLAEAR